MRSRRLNRQLSHGVCLFDVMTGKLLERWTQYCLLVVLSKVCSLSLTHQLHNYVLVNLLMSQVVRGTIVIVALVCLVVGQADGVQGDHIYVYIYTL